MRPPWPIGFRDANEPPSWAEAHRRLQKEGRRSRVSRPSEAQLRFEIRELTTRRPLPAQNRGTCPCGDHEYVLCFHLAGEC